MFSPPDFGMNIIKHDLHVCCPYCTVSGVGSNRFWSAAPINLGLWRWWWRKVVMVANLYECMQSHGCQEGCQYRQGLLTALATGILCVDMDYGCSHVHYISKWRVDILDIKAAVCTLLDIGCWSHHESYGCPLYTIWMLRMLPVYIWMLWMPAVHIMDAKDAPRVHMDVMDALCTHYGC